MPAISFFSEYSDHRHYHDLPSALQNSTQGTTLYAGEQTRRIGELQAQIRDSHLQTHLKQTALLNQEQIAAYASLRGYTK